MTDKTNQCAEHSGLVGCAANLKREIDDKMWPAIRNMVPRWIFILVGSIVISFGLLLIGNNSLSIADNEKDIRCLQQDINSKLERIEKAVTEK